MLIKIKTHKRLQAIPYLVEYLTTDKGRSHEHDINSFAVFQNLDVTDAQGVIAAFQENDWFRRKRKGGVVVQHHVLSFSPEDDVDLATAHDLTLKWLEIRDNESVCYAKAHVHENHFHVHILESGNKWRSGESTRKSKAELQQEHVLLEQYQHQTYPSLSHSFVKIREREKTKSQETELDKHLKKRGQSKKEQIRKWVHEAWSASYDSQEFYGKLAKHGLGLYEYRGQLRGVLHGNRRHRFSSLGLDIDLIRELDDEKARRRKELERIQRASGRDLGRER